MSGPKFVDELPQSAKAGAKTSPLYDALCADPGRWAEWWGANLRSVHNISRAISRPGFRFEGVVRNGKAYVRAVKA